VCAQTIAEPAEVQASLATIAEHTGEYMALLPPRPTTGPTASPAPGPADPPFPVADVVAAAFCLQSHSFPHVVLVAGDGFAGKHCRGKVMRSCTAHLMNPFAVLDLFSGYHRRMLQQPTGAEALMDHVPRKCTLCHHAGAPLPLVSSLADTATVAAAAAGRVGSTLSALWSGTGAARAEAPPPPPPKAGEAAAATATAAGAAPWMSRFKETSSVLSQRLKNATENLAAAALAGQFVNRCGLGEMCLPC